MKQFVELPQAAIKVMYFRININIAFDLDLDNLG